MVEISGTRKINRITGIDIMIPTQNAGMALTLTLLAGLFTGVGSVIAYFIKKPKMVYLSFSLGLSAGVMIYVSFVELLPQAILSVGQGWSALAFFIGLAFMFIIDLSIPETINPDHFKNLEEPPKDAINYPLLRTGLITVIAITIHNFPEGLVTFSAALNNIKLGIIITIAIALHNIPEGLSVSIPIYYATKNKNKAFAYSFLSGLTEPLGAIVGFLILRPFLYQGLIASLLAFIAGIMVYISIDELLPMAHKYGHSHLVISGVILGMLIMAISLLLLI